MEDTVTPQETGDEHLSQEQRFARWQAKRPNIDHLPEGVIQTFSEPDPETGLKQLILLPAFDVGDRIVVDRRTTLLRNTPWLETIVGKVRSIDDDTGLVTVWDEDGDARNPPCRYVNFKDEYHIFKLAPAKGNPFEPPKPEKKVAAPKDPNKRGRGRPKGSKNRPKDVIQAEKVARRQQKQEDT